MKKISRIAAVYFSPTGTTKKITETIAEECSRRMQLPWKAHSFTLPSERQEILHFPSNVLIIFGVPVYAGRVPNFLLSYLNQSEGGEAFGIPVVVYGNRNYDDALIELRDIMEMHHIHTIAGGAFIGEHSFSYTLGKGRPDKADLVQARSLADSAASSLLTETYATPIQVKGNIPYRPYYIPQKKDGTQKKITSVFPKISSECTNCGRCVHLCPMGSIADDCHSYTSFCIKCGACVKGCPAGARYYDDETYLYHKKALEQEFIRRAEPELFI